MSTKDPIKDILKRFEYWKYVKMGGVRTQVLLDTMLDREEAKQAIEAYIAEQIIEKLEHLATSDPRYTHAALKDELAELKSNERVKDNG